MVGRFPLADELVDDDDQTEDKTSIKSSKSNRLKRCRLVAAFTAGAVVEVHVVVADQVEDHLCGLGQCKFTSKSKL